ncbi:hypothetical protein ACQPZG_31860 [Streptomyces sp. CA-294286]|uniref:hypothetical protein n=1 Tax=Streptomyces sp. CA-294286 TaxID=3240070 RepID=UPI003D8B737C
MPNPLEPPFHLDNYTPADEATEESFSSHFEISQDMLGTLAEHHTADGRHSYLVLHDGTVTWGHPGLPQLVALHLERDTETETFTFEHKAFPLPAMAQSWLISRGCPREATVLPEGIGTDQADATTTELHERLMGDGDHFAYLDSYTHDMSNPCVTTVLLRHDDENDPQPFRVVVETADTDTWTHTLREGAFDTYEAALTWLRSGDTPLPPPPLAPRTTTSQALPPRAPSTVPPRGQRR